MDENADDLPEAPEVAAGSGRRLWLIVAVALVLGAAVGTGVTIFLMRGDAEGTAGRPWVPPAVESPVGGDDKYLGEAGIQKYCLDRGGKQTVIAYFDGDDPDPAMRRAAAAMDGDERIVWVKTETRLEAYERFKKIFADEPELVALARPEALPASVTLLPADDVYAGDLADAITGEFSEIESLSAGCELPG